MYERAVESYGRYYHVAWPNREADAARGSRRSPLHATLASAGAVYGNKFGWERPNWFAAPGTAADRGAVVRARTGVRCDRRRAPRRARARRTDRHDVVLEIRGARSRRARAAAEARRQRRRSPRRHDRLHAAVQRARRHRGGRHDHAARRRSFLLRHRQRARRARPLDDRAPHARRTAASTIVEQTSAKAVLNLCGPASRDVLAH